MGFIKNLFKYEKIKNLKAGFAIGYHRNSSKKDLLKDGNIFEENIIDVTNNLYRKTKNERVGMFLVQKENSDFKAFDDFGGIYFESLEEAVLNGEIQQTNLPFVPGQNIKQYIIKRNNEYILIIPSRGYVSDWFKEISGPDEFGRRKVTESDLDTRLKKIPAGRNLSYYVNDVGERVSPKFVSEVDAGDYVILWAPDDKEQMLDYICRKKDFNQMSYGYHTIDYAGGKFFAKEGPYTCFLIDEQGKRVSNNLTRYWVLDNGTAVCEENHNIVNIYDNDYKLSCVLDNHTVCAKTGVVAGRVLGEKDYVMFGLNQNNKYPVNGNCAELIIKILGGSVPPHHYTAGLLNDLTEEDINNTINVYENIMKENLEINPNSVSCKALVGNVREKFLAELKEAMVSRVRRIRKDLKAIDKERFKQTALLKEQIKRRNMIDKMLSSSDCEDEKEM